MGIIGHYDEEDNFGEGEFTVSIRTGNAAMITSEDLATTLEKIARRVRDGQIGGKIRDFNGNTVGQFNYMFDDEFEGKEENDDERSR